MFKEKLLNTKYFLMTLALLVMFTNCQEEYVEINEPDKSKTISADDNIADLILKVVLKEGSFDNIINRCSEISINFPYSIIIDAQLYNVSSQEDIDIIMFDYYRLRDDIAINYPVTISYSDYSETVLNNADKLEQIQEQHNDDLNDNDIECIDFVYPIELTLYNTEFQKTNLIVAYDDYDLFNIFVDISNLIIEFDFPISVEIENGEIINIANNFELENSIVSVISGCDGNDDVEFDDEDFPYAEIIAAQEWEVSFYSDTTDATSSFNSYIFNFNSDNIVQAKAGTEIIYGNWEIGSDSLTYLDIEFDIEETPIEWLNDSWLIKNFSSAFIEMEAESDFDGFTKKLNLIKSE